MAKIKKHVYNPLKVRGQDIVSLYSLPRKTEFIKELKKISEIDKISIVSDKMFHTMLGDPRRKEYSATLISLILEIEYQKLLNNMKLVSTEVPKEKANSVSQRCDYICEIDDTVVTV